MRGMEWAIRLFLEDIISDRYIKTKDWSLIQIVGLTIALKVLIVFILNINTIHFSIEEHQIFSYAVKNEMTEMFVTEVYEIPNDAKNRFDDNGKSSDDSSIE